MRSRLTKAKKEVHRLEKTLAKTASTATSGGDGQASRGRGAGAPISPSAGALLGDWVAEERPSKNGGESKWALSRRSVNGEILGRDTEHKRSAPVGGGSGARAVNNAGRTGLKSGERGFDLSSVRDTGRLEELWGIGLLNRSEFSAGAGLLDVCSESQVLRPRDQRSL